MSSQVTYAPEEQYDGPLLTQTSTNSDTTTEAIDRGFQRLYGSAGELTLFVSGGSYSLTVI